MPTLTPYYQDDCVTLYHADCLENLEYLDSADVLVTDPPYGMAYQSNSSKYKKPDPIAGDATTEARDRVLEYWVQRGICQRLFWHMEDS